MKQIDPADYPDDTAYLMAIPGMYETIEHGSKTPIDQCRKEPKTWKNLLNFV